MRRKKLVACFLAGAMGISMALTGCSGQQEGTESADQREKTEAETTPFGKYEETLVYTVGKETPGSPRMPEGDTYEDNAYTRYLLEELNIQNENEFEAGVGDAYNQKVSMAIATGKIPDVMTVDRSTLKQLVDNDMIADLTEVYEQCASDRIKEMYDSYGGRALDMATFDGKLMAMPSTACDNVPTFLWIRQDWLDKVGMEAPSTLEELEKVLTAFRDKDPGKNGAGKTIPLAISRTIGGSYGALFQADNIMSIFGSYPRQWLKDDSGKVYYGSTSGETKEALGFLADWYKKKLIDPQIAVREDIESTIVNGECGAFFGPWWAPDYPLNDARKVDGNADWRPYVISEKGDGAITAFTQNPASGYYVVRKGYEHPEILPKIASVMCDKLVYEDYNYEPIVEYNKANVDTGVKPVGILINYSTATTDMYQRIQEAIDGELDPDKLNIDDYSQYLKCEEYLKDPEKATPDAWSGYTSRMVGAKLMYETKVTGVNPVYFGQTKSMKLKWANLCKLEDEAFIKIVTGEKPLDYFDSFVKSWKSTGGDTIIAEVEEEISGQ